MCFRVSLICCEADGRVQQSFRALDVDSFPHHHQMGNGCHGTNSEIRPHYNGAYDV
ncbi:hypothetical protein SK128_002522 [Halocaridina rubra]|uniref:Uncharacterized protein n=1 Tax=Halocaridina rubra TaxID=373956 RepID=A0AAN8ZSI5_HALRR